MTASPPRSSLLRGYQAALNACDMPEKARTVLRLMFHKLGDDAAEADRLIVELGHCETKLRELAAQEARLRRQVQRLESDNARMAAELSRDTIAAARREVRAFQSRADHAERRAREADARAASAIAKLEAARAALAPDGEGSP